MLWTSAQSRFMAWLGIVLVAACVLGALAPVLAPFLLGWCLAYVLHPWVDRCERWRVPRSLGAALVLAVLLMAIVLIMLLMVPVLAQQIPLLQQQIPAALTRLNDWWLPVSDRLGINVTIDVNMARTWLRTWLSVHEADVMQGLMASLKMGGSTLGALLAYVLLVPLVAYYLMLDWAAFVRRCAALVPLRWLAPVSAFFQETDAVLGQYMRGQALVIAILAVFYTVGLAWVGVRLALPIGLFTGLSVAVPYIGFGIGLCMAVVVAALQFQSLAVIGWVLLVYGMGQVLESVFLTPKLLGERIGLHPLAVIFSLMAFGQLFGFVGVLVALPLSAVMLVMLRRLQALYWSSAMYQNAPQQPAAPVGGHDL
jgi:predicted PurR-regulated permease PerM